MRCIIIKENTFAWNETIQKMYGVDKDVAENIDRDRVKDSIGRHFQSEYSKGAACCRDNIMANIIGMQNELGNDENNPKYQVLQELLLHIIDAYGDMMKPYKA